MSIPLIGGHADGQKSRDYGKYCQAASASDVKHYANPSPAMTSMPEIRVSTYRKEILRVKNPFGDSEVEIYVVEGMDLITAIRKLCFHYKP